MGISSVLLGGYVVLREAEKKKSKICTASISLENRVANVG